jgi:integrase
LQGKLDTLENLAHRVGWSVIARLTLGPATREQLRVCGNSARVTEHVKALRRSTAILDRGDLITLVRPAAHRKVQDALDDIARSLAMVDYLRSQPRHGRLLVRGPLHPAARATRPCRPSADPRVCSLPHPHLLRHTFCAQLIADGADLREVQGLAGHRSIATTQRYVDALRH